MQVHFYQCGNAETTMWMQDIMTSFTVCCGSSSGEKKMRAQPAAATTFANPAWEFVQGGRGSPSGHRTFEELHLHQWGEQARQWSCHPDQRPVAAVARESGRSGPCEGAAAPWPQEGCCHRVATAARGSLRWVWVQHMDWSNILQMLRGRRRGSGR